MKWLKVTGVIMGALMITALGIDATDTLRGFGGSTLLGQLVSSQNTEKCSAGMIEVPMAETFTCVDQFEASASKECPHTNPQNELHTRENIDSVQCQAESKIQAEAWSFINRDQAQIACVRAGKRLPKYDEWHLLAIGTPQTNESCNVNGTGAIHTGSQASCKSAVGAYDAIGNVWEWTANDIIEGKLDGRDLPSSGYVAQADTYAVATVTDTTPGALEFSNDYFWSSKAGAFGLLRGGFFGSKSDAGLYAVHAQTLPTASGVAIGFRCVQ